MTVTQQDKAERAEQKITQLLQDAHSAELFAAQTLTAHIAMTPASSYRTLLETHLKQTRDQAQRIQRHLARRESDRGFVQVGYGLAQGAVTNLMAMSKAPIDMVRGMSGEEKLLRNARDECATEAIEIVTYLAIEQVARQVGDRQTEQLATTLRQEEELMLERLLKEIPRLATDVVSAEVDGNPQFVFTRTGAVDAARTVASTAARTLSRGANRAARTASPPRGSSTSSTRRSPQGNTDATVSTGPKRKSTARKRPTSARKRTASSPKRSGSTSSSGLGSASTSSPASRSTSGSDSGSGRTPVAT